MYNSYKNIEEYDPTKKRKILNVFNDIWLLIWLETKNDMLSNKKLNPVVTKLFIRRTKLNIFQSRIIEQAKFTYYLLQKAVETQIETIELQSGK